MEIPDYSKCLSLSSIIYNQEKALGPVKIDIASSLYAFGHQCIYLDIIAKHNRLNPEKKIIIVLDPDMVSNQSLLKAQIASGIDINIISRSSNLPEIFRIFSLALLPSVMGIDQAGNQKILLQQQASQDITQ